MSLIKPFKGKFRITQSFGVNPDAYKKFNLAGHNGIDWGLPVGTPIIASISGIVSEVDFDKDGYGLYVKIYNANEACLVGHLSETCVQIGFTVKQGEKIGLSGNTGNSTGPHVHFGYYPEPRDRSNGFNGYVNPELYLTESEDSDMSDEVISQELAKQYKEDREMFWKQRDEEIAKNKLLTDQLNELKTKFDVSFKLLAEVNDYGFKDINELKDVVDPYREMYLAGFPNLKSIEARLAGLTLKVQNLSELVGQSATQEQEIIDLKKELSDLKTRYPLLDKNSLWNKLAQLLELLKKIKPVKSVTLPTETKLITDPTLLPKVQTTVNAFEDLVTSIGINK